MKLASRLTPRLRRLLAGLPLAALPAAAQVISTTAPVRTLEEDVLVLSPFVVNTSSEEGYYSPESVGATRTRTALIDLPINLTVFNENFINDVGARDLADIVAFSSSVSPSPTASSDNAGGDTLGLNIRGQSAFVPNRNGVRRLRVVDPVTIQRVEVIKGPNSLLYGPAAPGGGINYVTKRPVQRRITSTTMQVGSYEFYKASVDINVPAFDKSLAVRFVGSYEDSQSWIDRFQKYQKVLYPSVTWWIRPETTLTVEYEQTVQDRDPPQSAMPQHLWLDPEDVARTVGRGWNMRGRNDYHQVDMTAFTAEFQHRINRNFNLRLNWSDVSWQDTVKNSAPGTGLSNAFAVQGIAGTQPAAGGTPPPAASPALGGRTHSYGKRGSWDKYRQLEVYNQFEIGGVKFRNLVGYQLGEEKFKVKYSTSGAANDTTLWQINDPSTWILSERFAETHPVYYAASTGAYAQNNLKSWYAINQLTMFNDKLHTLAGVRHDTIDSEGLSDPTIANTVRFGIGEPPPPKPTLTYTSASYPSKTSPQFGVLFKPVQGLSFYANYSRSLVNLYTSLARRPDGTEFRPVPGTGEGFDFGVKTDMFRNMFSGVISFYQVEEKDIVRNLPQVSLSHINNGAPFTPSEQSGINRSQGVEVDLAARPMKGLQIGFGYSYNDSYVKSDVAAVTYLGGGSGNGTRVETRTGHQLAYTTRHRFTAYVRKDFGKVGPFQTTYVTANGIASGDRPWTEAWYKRVTSTTDPGVLTEPGRLDAYQVFNVGVGGELRFNRTRVNVSLMAKNVFDEQYLANRNFWAAPREFLFTTRIHF